MTSKAGGAPLMRPIITEKGFAAASQAATLGVPVKITHIGLTAAGGAGAETDESLPNAQILPIADGKVVSNYQVNVSALLPDTFPTMEIKGIAFYLEDGTMFATYRKTETIISHSGGTTLLIGMDFVMSNIPPESVTVESTEANLVLGDWVPVQRRVNGKALSADIILNAADVNAAPAGFGLGASAPALNAASCNTATVTGWYGINNATTETPDGTGPSGSAMQVVRWGATGVHQVFYDYANDRTYTRRFTGSKWNPWVMMYNTANPPPAADMSAYVPKTRKVNNKALDVDINLTASDVGASPSNHTHSNYVPTTRKVNGKPLSSDVSLTAVEIGITNVGLGGAAVNINDLGITDLNKIKTSGHYYTSNATDANRPSHAAGPIVHIHGGAGYQQYVRDNVLMFRGFTGDVFQSWQTVYHTGNVPSASTVGALPITGGQVNGTITTKPATGANGLNLIQTPSATGTNAVGIVGFDKAGNTREWGCGMFYSAGKPQYAYYGTGASPWAAGLKVYPDRVEANSKIASNHANPRGWTQVGESAFFSSQINMSAGSLAGLVSGRVNIATLGVYEHGYGFLAATSIDSSSNVLFCNNGGSYNKYWAFRNDGLLAPPGDKWGISSTGMLSGSAWSSTGAVVPITTWLHATFAPKVTTAYVIGSYIMGCVNVNSGINAIRPNMTVAGSLIFPSGVCEYSEDITTTLPGTWMAMGSFNATNSDDKYDDRMTLFMRTA